MNISFFSYSPDRIVKCGRLAFILFLLWVINAATSLLFLYLAVPGEWEKHIAYVLTLLFFHAGSLILAYDWVTSKMAKIHNLRNRNRS